ncbi:DUF3093 family protein [Salipiger sp. PrR003]|uniref:DUF3093 family protein n=1 Tax=Salipiger sp. PrR003 TaxID=2706776 RepID=UPI0013D905A1|nr:DUF3093 family protein [Salipiger sp. PrR003]NDV50530.1 DUF3093 family protein [Salipiger sp. PrR003]
MMDDFQTWLAQHRQRRRHAARAVAWCWIGIALLVLSILFAFGFVHLLSPVMRAVIALIASGLGTLMMVTLSKATIRIRSLDDLEASRRKLETTIVDFHRRH